MRANARMGVMCIPSRLFTNVENHSDLLLIQDLNVVVLRQSVPHFQWWDELCRDLRNDLRTCAHQTISQLNDVSNRMQIFHSNVELSRISKPMDSFQLCDWDDALVLRDALDGLKKQLVGSWNEDGVLLEDGGADMLQAFSQFFHSFVLEWWHHEVLVVERDVGPLLLPWWQGIHDVPWWSGLFALRSHHKHSPLRSALVGWWEGGLQEVEPVCALLDLHLFGSRQIITHDVDHHLFHKNIRSVKWMRRRDDVFCIYLNREQELVSDGILKLAAKIPHRDISMSKLHRRQVHSHRPVTSHSFDAFWCFDVVHNLVISFSKWIRKPSPSNKQAFLGGE